MNARLIGLALASVGCLNGANAQSAGTTSSDLSLDSLLNIKINSASKQWEVSSDAPATVSIVTSEDIVRFGYETLDDILSSLPGFYTSNDRNYAYIGVRGFSRPTDYNDRILLLLNGHTINEAFYGSSPFGTDFALNMNVVDRVEVVRGPGSALYGSGAMFAVVNVITKAGSDVNGILSTGELGSFGRRSAAITLGKDFGQDAAAIFSAQFSDIKGHDLYYREYDTDSTNNGVAENLDWDKSVGFYSTARYKEFQVQGLWSSREKGIPTGAYEMAFNDRRAHTLDRYALLEMSMNSRVSESWGVMSRLYYDHYYYAGTFPYDIPFYDATHAYRIGGEGQIQWDVSSRNRLIGGIEYIDIIRSDYHYWNDDTTLFDRNFPFTTLSVYIQDEHQLTSNLSLTLGVRRDVHSISGNPLAPRAAIVYHPSLSTSMKLLFGQAYRTPNMYELNYEDSYSGFKASHNLTRESISTLELAWEQRLSDELYWVTSAFRYTMGHLIDQEIDPGDSLIQFKNVQSVKAHGVETSLTFKSGLGISGYANYTYEYTEDKASGATLTNVPIHMAKVGFSYGLLRFLRTGFEFQYQSGRKTLQELSTDSFGVTNLILAVAPPAKSDALPELLSKVRVSVIVRNVFDVRYVTPGGFEHRQAAIEQNGREWIGKLELGL